MLRARFLDFPAAYRVIARYAAAAAIGNLIWEVLQLPLYSLWRTASPAYLVFAVFHCWVGDLLIAAASLGLGIAVAGRRWPSCSYARVTVAALVFGLAYTVFSEWLNVAVHSNWSYAPAMPRLPPLGTGLAPLLQWIVIPGAAFILARPHSGRIATPER